MRAFQVFGEGSKNSSGYQLARTGAAKDFALALRAQRHDLQTKALRDLFEMSNTLLGQQPVERGLVEKYQKPMGFGKQLGLGAVSGLFGLGSSLLARGK